MRRGEKVGKYRLTKGPVEGGRGAVWFAVDTELGRPVVLKRALLEDNSQADFDQLLAEARALAKFSHPHVVTLYDAVRAGKGKKATFWLVMEHVTGGSLDVPVKMAPQLAAHIGAQIAAALAALHAKGIVHCDVKPGNIVITHDRVAKLADFGAAYRVDGSETITPNGPISLTPAYAAPEAFRAAPERASDVFSLGATLHWLVTGTPPLRGPGRAVRLEAISPQAGPLGGVLTAMLQHDPRARPTAADSLAALAGIAGSPDQLPTLPLTSATTPYTDTVAGVEDPTAQQRSRATTLVRRRPLLTAGVAVVTALAVAVPLVVMRLGGESDADEPVPPAGSGKRAGASGFIGDPRTADPCALLDATAFPRYEEAELDGDEGNFNRCDVVLKEGGEDVVDVRVELDADPLPEGVARKTTGRVTVVEVAAEEKECKRAMTVTGARGNSLRVTAVARDDKVKEPLCRTADVATGVAVKVLNGGEIPRRPAFASDSLAHQDACTLLDAKALEEVPGIDAKDPDVGFGRWDCQWKSTTNDLEVDLRFDQGGMTSDKNARRTSVGGHQVIVLEGHDGAGSCRVEVVYRPYVGVDRVEGTERVVVVVKGAGRKGRPCGPATDLAGSAAAALPPV